MPANRIALDLAAFLDSAEARALPAPPHPDLRRIVQAFLEVCYDELGKAPHLLDDHDVHTAVGHALPGRLQRKDPLAEHVPAVLEAFFDHLETRQTVLHAYEIRRGLAAVETEFRAAVESGENAHRHAPPQKPFVHRASKLSRNDPCSCGSGKKYKKCHGKGA